MPRESAADKGRRYLTEGRLTVLYVEESAKTPIYAQCKGESGEIYKLGFDALRNEWRCTCEAHRKFHSKCSHLHALQLVTTRPGGHK